MTPPRLLQLARLVFVQTAVLAVVLLGAGLRPASAAPGSWAFAAMDVPAARPTGDGVLVAVVDSGIDMDHPAFAGRIAGATDCTGSGGDPSACRDGTTDDNGHGTHIAGIIAAGATEHAPEGVAPNAQLLAVRALTNTCEGRDEERRCRALGELDDVVDGVRWATQHDADLINLSIDASVGLDWESGALADAVRDAWRAGAVVVASTGNRSVTVDDTALRSVPLLLVGALGADGEPASYSNLPGTARWGLMAPGGEAGGACPEAGVLSTYPRTIEAAGTGCLAGTSMAAAYVTGALASLVSTGMDGRDALSHLLATADGADGTAHVDLGAALRDLSDATPLANASIANAGDVAERPLADRWLRIHPLTARLVGAAAIAVFAAVVVNRRRDVLPGF